MVISYFLNQMGVYNLQWYVDNGIPVVSRKFYSEVLGTEVTVREPVIYYSAGRIDISGVEGHPHGIEYSVDVMEERSWGLLSDWLYSYTTSHLLSLEELLATFESETGHKIKWWVQ